MSALLASRLQSFGGPTVWQEFTPLAMEKGAVNLGQGFPDWPAPQFVKDALCKAVLENANQYCRSAGDMALVTTLANIYSKKLARSVSATTEVTISVGASEALFALLQSLVNPGDEVVILEPAFDLYTAQTVVAGGVCKFVPLRVRDDAKGEKEWYLDMAEFAAAFSDRTKVFILNSPQNPTGKVFSPAELTKIAAVIKAQPQRVVVISDEVYEHLTFDGLKHTPFATIPGMWEHTATVGSSGKTFSVTGWKCGWIVGPEDIVSGVIVANQWIQFSVCTPVQKAIAACLEQAELPYEGKPTYYAWLNEVYSAKRARLLAALKSGGLKPIVPQGSFFIMADTSDVDVPAEYLAQSTPACPIMTRDWAFCRWLTVENGVAAIPPSAFYCDEHKHMTANYVRFAFCKTDDALETASARFAALGDKLKP